MVRTVTAVALITIAGYGFGGAPNAPPDDSSSKGVAEICQILATPVTMEAISQTPLKDVVELLADRYKAPFLIEHDQFQAEGVPDVQSAAVQLPALKGIRLSNVLERLTAQVQAGFLVKADHIAIVPRSQLKTTIWGNEPVDAMGRERQLFPLVYAVFNDRPLDEALQQLANMTGTSVIMDRRRAPEQATATITATLVNVPLDTAVKILANQAELESVLLDNALYVTVPENAQALRHEMRPELKTMLGAKGGLGALVGAR